MSEPTNVQIINGQDGKPEFAIIPYDDYLQLSASDDALIPHEVVSATVDGATPMRAWRVYLGLTQRVVAERLGVSQSAYAQMERQAAPRHSSLVRVAAVFGISIAQLDF